MFFHGLFVNPNCALLYNLFYGATVGAIAARITHILHRFQLCDFLQLSTNIKELSERERERFDAVVSITAVS